jgi:hypothetical protein
MLATNTCSVCTGGGREGEEEEEEEEGGGGRIVRGYMRFTSNGVAREREGSAIVE